MKFNRRSESVASDWRENPKVVKARARIEELDVLIQQAEGRLFGVHAPRVADAGEALRRAELETLAGRSTDAQLAVAQQRHLDARIAEAKDRLAIEDLSAERADLINDKLPAIEKKARAVVHAAMQAKAVALLKEL